MIKANEITRKSWIEYDQYCAKTISEMWIKKRLSEKGTNQPEVKNTSNHLLSTSGKNCVNFVDSSIFREFWEKNCNVLQLYRFLQFLRCVLLSSFLFVIFENRIFSIKKFDIEKKNGFSEFVFLESKFRQESKHRT